MSVEPTPKRDTSIEKLDIDYFDEAFHLNLSCTMYLSQLVIPVMKTHGGGNIVNVASISGITADSNGTHFTVPAKQELSILPNILQPRQARKISVAML